MNPLLFICETRPSIPVIRDTCEDEITWWFLDQVRKKVEIIIQVVKYKEPK